MNTTAIYSTCDIYFSQLFMNSKAFLFVNNLEFLLVFY